MDRAWRVVGVCVLGFVLVEGAYRVAGRLRARLATSAPAPRQAPKHPYADSAWFRGWYGQPTVRGGIVFDPYRAFHKAAGHTPGVTIDSAGRRLTVQAATAATPRRRVFLLGGSTMWGYTARDSFTIASFVARKLAERGIADVEVVNLAQPGYNATQEVITLLLALRDGEIPAAAVFLTTHKDIYAAFQAGRPGGITSEDVYGRMLDESRVRTLRDDVGALARRSAIVARAFPAPAAAAPKYPEPSDALCDPVAREYRELARMTTAIAREYRFPFVFMRQPMLALTHKPLSAFERNLPRPRWEPHYLRCMATIDSVMAGTAQTYRSLAHVFDTDTASVFLDEYGYLTEAAGAVVADRIVEALTPMLARPSSGRAE